MDSDWFGVLPRTRLQPDTRHRFLVPASAGPATHVRLDIYPDGGMARLRLHGRTGLTRRKGTLLTQNAVQGALPNVETLHPPGEIPPPRCARREPSVRLGER